jgi:hypothetical protein
LVVAVLTSTLVVAVPAAGAGTLDQSQPVIGNGLAFVSSNVSTGQTFTNGLTGRLDQVDLAVSRGGAPVTLPLTIQIRTTSGGVPSATILATANLPSTSIPIASPPGFLSVALAPSVPVTAGVQYAIVLSSGNCGFSNCFQWWFPPGTNAYAAGAGLQSLSGGPWGATGFLTNSDLAFKTYVAQAPANKAECKKGGWKHFVNPRFKNQGQCIAFVNHHNGKGKDDANSGGTKGGKGKKNR